MNEGFFFHIKFLLPCAVSFPPSFEAIPLIGAASAFPETSAQAPPLGYPQRDVKASQSKHFTGFSSLTLNPNRNKPSFLLQGFLHGSQTLLTK